MMKLIDTTPHLYQIAKVEAIAAEMQASDEDWTYTPDYDPKGTSPYARIIVNDEDGEFVAYL